MSNQLNILSLDLGKRMGFNVNVDGEMAVKGVFDFEGLASLEKWMKDLIILWKINLVLIPYPTRFYQVILKHGKMMGVINCVAEKRDITVIEVQDATCKKSVLGNGKAQKDDIMKHFKEENEHIADSLLFTAYYLKEINYGNKKRRSNKAT